MEGPELPTPLPCQEFCPVEIIRRRIAEAHASGERLPVEEITGVPIAEPVDEPSDLQAFCTGVEITQSGIPAGPMVSIRCGSLLLGPQEKLQYTVRDVELPPGAGQ